MFGSLMRIGIAFAAGAGAEAAVKKVVSPETRQKFTAAARQAGTAVRGLGTDVKNSAVRAGEYVDHQVEALDRWLTEEPPKTKQGPKDGLTDPGAGDGGGKGPTAKA